MLHQALAADARRLAGGDGLCIEIYDHGCVRRIDHGATMVNLFLPNAVECGLTQLYLRSRLPNGSREACRLLGPASATRGRRVAQNRWVGVGTWQGLRYAVTLQLSHQRACWFWHVDVENTQDADLQLDLVYTQDVGLAAYGAIRLNEYYVSQYIDHTPLRHERHGWSVASRQNLASDRRHPWCLIGSLGRAESFATDALQVHGLALRSGAATLPIEHLPATRLQHEHSLVALEEERVSLAPGASHQFGFFGLVSANHPDASSAEDLTVLEEATALAEAAYTPVASDMRADPATPVSGANWFTAAPPLSVSKPDAVTLRSLFPGEWRHRETDPQSNVLSFFYGEDRHVVLRDKELLVLRPHGHLLRTGRAAVPDEGALTSTVWMAGVFNSMLTQGHVSINRLLSTVHSYLGVFRSHGQRVFVDLGQGWRLLDVPSIFEISPDACRWIYLHAQGQIEVTTRINDDPHELHLEIAVSNGVPVRCLITHHVALNGDDGSTTQPIQWVNNSGVIELRPAAGTELHRRFPHGSFQIAAAPGTRVEQVGGDELLFLDGRSRQQPYLCFITAASSHIELHLRGRLIGEQKLDSALCWTPSAQLPVIEAPNVREAAAVGRMAAILPWFTHNALIHYLSPRGLEQYSGGGWGTRDVTQGPVELLLALNHVQPIRDLLIRVMKAQNANGDWPQWFMFFERERTIRAADSHGDIVFWPLLALAQYLLASGDTQLLDEPVPFFDMEGSVTMWDHVERALGVIRERRIERTALAAYGHGDWNDSLQPADPAMREHMCSAWTVTLHHQVLTTLARAMRLAERARVADELEAEARRVREDFQRLLIIDDVLAGYALFDAGKVRYLLHPRDESTGVQYSSLAMIHAILEGLLTPAQAKHHLDIIRQHLLGPDGVRLFDRPLPYRGGTMRFFQRAETATFFGREIGLMYMHAHLRYAQALAYLGETDAFFVALSQANPIAIRELVPSATVRQANCYYSSSDAAFNDRYEASARYEDINTGRVALDGGWRVYSSGAGIAVGLIIRRFLGISCEHRELVLDPVIPRELSGLRVELSIYERPCRIAYSIQGRGHGVTRVTINGEAMSFDREENPYRQGAARLNAAAVRAALRGADNEITIELGNL